MDRQEFLDALDRLELDPVELADVVGIGVRTARRFASAGNVPAPIAKLIRLMVEGRVSKRNVTRA